MRYQLISQRCVQITERWPCISFLQIFSSKIQGWPTQVRILSRILKICQKIEKSLSFDFSLDRGLDIPF
jgi:hypothetical protein